MGLSSYLLASGRRSYAELQCKRKCKDQGSKFSDSLEEEHHVDTNPSGFDLTCFNGNCVIQGHNNTDSIRPRLDSEDINVLMCSPWKQNFVPLPPLHSTLHFKNSKSLCFSSQYASFPVSFLVLI